MKPLKHAYTLQAYNNISVSCDSNNVSLQYPGQQGEIGTPDVKWKDVYFKSFNQSIWTHGKDWPFTSRNIRKEINELKYRLNILEDGVSAQLAGDILVVNNDTLEKVFCSIDQLMQLDENLWTPIGAVIIPASHNVYGDYSSLVVSMMPMSCDTPQTGGTKEQAMRTCPIAETPLKEYNDVACVAMNGGTGDEYSTIIGTFIHANLPSDTFTGEICPHDTGVNYVQNLNGASVPPYCSPSPFLTDGSRNPNYYSTTSPSSPANALSDFGGRANCNLMLGLRGNRDYSTWKPQANVDSDYPAVSCCDMFYTVGTKQGDWYLPSVGEYGYIMTYLGQLNKNIEAIITKFGVGVKFGLNNYYLTSTKRNATYMRTIRTDVGYVGYHDTSAPTYVRAVLRVPPTKHMGEIQYRVPGEILVANINTLERRYYTAETISTLENPSEWWPVGIVVIPTSHNVYGNGCCGIISIKAMDVNNPKFGSGGTKLYWGQHGVNTALPDKNETVVCDNTTNDTLTVATTGYYANDKSVGVLSTIQCSLNSRLKYYSAPYIPSPYLENGSRNPGYYNTEVTRVNFNADFDGKGNTRRLALLHTVDDLSTATSITNEYGSNAAPAAAVCTLYCPTGTNKGDWYLPAIGEYGYVVANYKHIVASTSAINAIWSGAASAIASSDGYWTSTENSATTAHGINFDYCKNDTLDKNTANKWARAFLQAL